jgi:hypothetical protein
MKSNYETEGQKIEIKEYQDHDGYQTAIGLVKATGGISDMFEVHISGQPESIRDYVANAVFLKLELVQDAEADRLREEHQARALATLRAQWYGRLRKIRSFVSKANIDQLNNPDLQIEAMGESGKPNEVGDIEFDPQHGRLIEILPMHDFERGCNYALTVTIHPDILQGQWDYHSYRYGEPNANDASMTVSDGDADLYLYRGGVRKGRSANGVKASEYVYGRNGIGDWEVRVYGFSNAIYELDASWY